MEAVDLLIAQTDLLVEEEDVVFHLAVDSLQLGNFLFEFIATVISTAKLLSPNIGLALIGAKLRVSLSTSRVWVVVLPW